MSREDLVSFLSSELGLHAKDAQDDTALFSTGLLDSFGLVDLVSFLEKETGNKVGAMEVTLENFDSIERILAFAREKSAAS